MRWLSHRGGALDFRDHANANSARPSRWPWRWARIRPPCWAPSRRCPIRCRSTSSPGLLRGCAHRGRARPRQRPARAGLRPRSCWKAICCRPATRAPTRLLCPTARRPPPEPATRWRWRPHGDHTGYYNEQDWFPVFTVDAHHHAARSRSTTPPTPASRPTSLPCWVWRSTRSSCRCCAASCRKSWTSTCRPRAAATAWPWCPIRKQYAGHAKRVMFGLWSILRQFMYTKFIVVVRRRHRRARLEGSGLGDDHPHGPGARHPAGRRTPRSTTWISPRRCPAWAARWAWTPPTSGRARPPANGARPSAWTMREETGGRDVGRVGAADRLACLSSI